MSKTRAVAYVRVSTDKQADKGVSLESQEAKIRAYCSLYEIDLVAVVADPGASGKTLDRPGLERVRSMLKAGVAEALVVAKLDRLTRSVRDLGELLEEHFGEGGSALLSVGEQIDTRSAAGRLVLNVLGSVSQWERETIAERTSAALQHKARKGEFTGGVAPYGYRLSGGGKALEEVPEEQKIIGLARRLRATPGNSLRRISKTLAFNGYVARNGKPFAPDQIRRMTDETVRVCDRVRAGVAQAA